MSEYNLQVAIIDHLRGQRRSGKEIILGTKPFIGLFVTHIYQGRSKGEGFHLKRMGVYPGVSDILCLWKGGFGFIEVKTQNGYLSPPQKKFKGMCQAMEIKWAIARSVQDAHAAIKRWGLPENYDTVCEPDLRTDEQKEADAQKLWGVKKYLTAQDLINGRINPDWKPG